MNLPKYLVTVTPLSKAFALILFILLPIVGFLLGMKYQAALDFQLFNISAVTQVSKQQNNTEKTIVREVPKTWKTYTNEKFGITLSFPRELIFEDKTGVNNNPLTVPLIVYLNHTGTINGYSISVEKRKCNKNTGLQEQPVTIGGKKGNRFIDEGYMNGSLFSNDNVEVQFNTDYCFNIFKYVDQKGGSLTERENQKTFQEMRKIYNDEFETILSSVEFAKSDEDITNWKTYINSMMGFSINYPPSFHIESEGKENIFFKEKSESQRILHINATKNPTNGESRSENNPFGPPITSVEDSFLGAENIQSFYLQGYPAAKAIYGAIPNQTSIVDKQDIDMHVLKNDTLWQIEIINNLTQENINESNKILSSFTFL